MLDNRFYAFSYSYGQEILRDNILRMFHVHFICTICSFSCTLHYNVQVKRVVYGSLIALSQFPSNNFNYRRQ